MSDSAREALIGALVAVPQGVPVGVAVSGGGDSVALFHMALEVLGASRLRVASVDHGLRVEAAGEAAGVVALAARHGVPGEVLRWEGGAAAPGNLMDAARRARLALLADWAAREGLGAVLLGHTRDDQAETVLMRLGRGSGLDGLSGMAPARRSHGTLWLRPLLGESRESLRAYLRGKGEAWIDDPSNENPRFLRVRAREALAALAPLGISAEGLAETASRLARARAALEAETAAALAAHLEAGQGIWRLTPGVFELPGDIRERVFLHLIRGIAGGGYPPRHASLARALAGLAAGQKASLAGVVLAPAPEGVRLWREAAAVAGLRAPADGLWDGRWRAIGPEAAEIAALGEAGLVQLSHQAREGLHPHWRETGLPRAALMGLPAIWQGERLIAAPLALWPQGWGLFAEALPGLGILWPESD